MQKTLKWNKNLGKGLLTSYSEVPNRRADPNKRAGSTFLKFTNRAGPNKRAGWVKSVKILNEHALLLLFI